MALKKEYKTISIVEKTEYKAGQPIENPMKGLTNYISDGYEVVNISTNHMIVQNNTFSNRKNSPSQVNLLTTYLLEKLS